MNDTISRQAAIRTIADTECEYDISPHIKDERTEEQKRKDWFDMCKVLFRQIIEDLPSAQPESRREWYMKGYRDAQRWIPVTERLPEEKGEYLVSYHPCYWDYVNDDIKSGIDSFRGKAAWAKKKYQRVIAWMPLPEPYKGGQDEQA